MRSMISRARILGALLALAACGGDDNGFSPTRETVSGGYTASVFTLTSPTGAGDSTTLDLLTLGASVDVTLDPNGTTAGRLFVPGAAEDGGDVDVDLAGTWSLSGNVVTFDQPGDTFIRDVDFIAGPGTLTAEEESDDGVIRIVLLKAQ